jgi:small subunit ribosomal protein S15
MYLDKEIKAEIFEKHSFSKQATDTGSPESQIALLTHRINHLTGHMKANRGDKHTQKGLLKMVGQRKRLLNYLHKKDITRYRAILEVLKLRK